MTVAQASQSRRRSEASHQSILDATHEILVNDGFDKLSIEGVAARARVGKTTIYRWWPSKGVLAVEAFLNASTPAIEFQETASPAADIVTQMRALAEIYSGPTGRFVREIVGSAQVDPATRKAFLDGFLMPRRQAAHAALHRAVAVGQIRPEVDPDVAIDALYGPIYYRLLVSGDPIDERYVRAHAAAVLSGLAV